MLLKLTPGGREGLGLTLTGALQANFLVDDIDCEQSLLLKNARGRRQKRTQCKRAVGRGLELKLNSIALLPIPLKHNRSQLIETFVTRHCYNPRGLVKGDIFSEKRKALS